MIKTEATEIVCQCCGKNVDPKSMKYSTNVKNIRLYRAVYPEIKLGVFCHPCYQRWRSKSINDPRMCLEKLYCGICHEEEPKAKFSTTFCRLNTPLLREYEKVTGKSDIILGPVCTDCFSKYPIPETQPKIKLEFVKLEKISKVNKEPIQNVTPVFLFGDETSKESESEDEKKVEKSSTKHQEKNFHCAWSDCSHSDFSNWKAQRHAWNVHLKSTPIYQRVFNTQSMTPTFEQLTKEEKEKLSGKIAQYISDSPGVAVQKVLPKVKSENVKVTVEEVCVDLRKFFPNDEFLKIPSIKKISKMKKMK
jgi:hypothetical protein